MSDERGMTLEQQEEALFLIDQLTTALSGATEVIEMLTERAATWQAKYAELSTRYDGMVSSLNEAEQSAYDQGYEDAVHDKKYEEDNAR